MARLAVDREDAVALGALAEDADEAARALADAADQAPRVGGALVLVRGQAGEDAVALAKGGFVGTQAHQHARLGAVMLVPLRGLGPEVAGVVGAGDAQHGDRGQGAGLAQVATVAQKLAIGLEFLEHCLEDDPVGALDAEGTRNVALGILARMVADPVDDLGLGGEWLAHVSRPSMARARGHAAMRALGCGGGRGAVLGRWRHERRRKPGGQPPGPPGIFLDQGRGGGRLGRE